MSDERMSEERFEQLCVYAESASKAWPGEAVAEARRARAEESRLAARVEVLEAALGHMRMCRACGEADLGECTEGAAIRAALTTPTPKETER